MANGRSDGAHGSHQFSGALNRWGFLQFVALPGMFLVIPDPGEVNLFGHSGRGATQPPVDQIFQLAMGDTRGRQVRINQKKKRYGRRWRFAVHWATGYRQAFAPMLPDSHPFDLKRPE